ncbi:adenosinetriphosphatase, partial [Exophiala viscosa]|uniref:adenosinetriphosphatase n=1 Tax=Exophiala viscosa TaxID=2486360 RepID=UPI002192F5DB
FAVEVPRSNIRTAVDAIKTSRKVGVPQSNIQLSPINDSVPATDRTNAAAMLDPPVLATKMAHDLQRKMSQDFMEERLRNRNKLPLMANKSISSELLRTINKHDVTVVLAKTGSGKTTQVPQLILEERVLLSRGPSTSIICAQPRRIAATSAARRVAYERGEVLGSHVGYVIRNDNESPKHTPSIAFYTIGILMHRLITGGRQMLQAHSHIIIDEVHERDAQIDLVLSLLRRTISMLKATHQPYPKVVLMSATIDPSRFLDYFRDPIEEGSQLSAESFEVEGRNHTVQTRHLHEILKELSHENELHPTMETLLQGKGRRSSASYIKNELLFASAARDRIHSLSEQGRLANGELRQELAVVDAPATSLDSPSNNYLGLVVAVVAYISAVKPDGDILVFLPGKLDIDTVHDELIRTKPLDLDFQDESRFRLFKLHSSLRDTNDMVFDSVPGGCRRIILATNIAETSITLPEVVHVVDTGKARTAVFDPLTLTRSLPFEWISRTNSIQRRGRAGRVRDGHYYALFSQERYETFRAMAQPRITVSNVVDIVLLLSAYPQPYPGGPRAFLRGMMDPPSEAAIDSAYKELTSLEALSNGRITKLGWIFAQMGIPPSAAKAVLLGVLFGCLEPMLILACHDFNNPLIYNGEISISAIRETKRLYDRDLESDLPILIDAFREYHAAYRSGNSALMDKLHESRSIRHASYMEMMLTSKAIHEVLTKLGLVPEPLGSGDTIFENLPANVDFNKDNMLLVKALAVNTISAEIAAWSAKTVRWELDVPSEGYISRNSVNYEDKKSVRRIKRKHRSDGRLMAYAWKRNIDDSEKDEAWLEHTTMVTPLVAILFSRSAVLDAPNVVELNKWLRLELKSHGADTGLVNHTARILTETKKTLDRFMTYSWRRLIPSYTGQDHATKLTASEKLHRLVQQDCRVKRLLSTPGFRNKMVTAITTMLSADDVYWAAYRTKRRAEIDAEEARLAEEARQMANPEDGEPPKSSSTGISVTEAQENDDYDEILVAAEKVALQTDDDSGARDFSSEVPNSVQVDGVPNATDSTSQIFEDDEAEQKSSAATS